MLAVRGGRTHASLKLRYNNDQLQSFGVYCVALTVFLIPLFSEAHIRVFGTSLINIMVVICFLVLIMHVSILLKVNVLFLSLTVIVFLGGWMYWISGKGTPWFQYRDSSMLLVYCTRAIFLLSMVWFIRTRRQVDVIKFTFITSAMLVVSVSTLRYFGLFPFDNYYISEEYGFSSRNFGTFIISGTYALWLGAAFCFLLYDLLFSSISTFRKLFLAMLMLLIVASSILVAHSRNLILFAFITTVILVWYRLNPRGMLLIVYGIFFACSTLLLGYHIYTGIMNDTIVLTARLTLINSALPYIDNYMMHGLGMGVFRDILSPRLQPVHNLFLDVLIDIGVYGLIPYLLLIVVLVKCYVRDAMFQTIKYPILAIMLATLLSVQFFPATLAFPLWFIIGICLVWLRAYHFPKSKFKLGVGVAKNAQY